MKLAHFERKRHHAEWILVAMAVVSLFVLNHFYGSEARNFTPRGFIDKADQIVDSILVARNISPDTVTVFKGLSTDSELIQSVSDSLGVLAAADYFLANDVYQHQFSIRMRVTKDASFNFSVNSGNVSSRSAETAAESSNLITNIWCDADGQIVGAQEILISRDSRLDSVNALSTLYSFLPQEMQNDNLQWELIETENRDIKYMATLEQDGIASKTLTLLARIRGDRSPLVEWRLDADPMMSQPSDVRGASSVTKLVLSILIILIVLGLLAVGVVRLVKRSVNLPIMLSIAIVAGSYYFLASIDILQIHWAFLILVFMVQVVLLGMLMYALPISGIFSLAREIFPSKFYTLLRLINKPWNSYFTGRSIVIGLSMGFIYSACIPLVMEWMAGIGNDGFFYGLLFSDQIVLLSMFSYPAIILAMMVYAPLISTAAILLFPVLAYRFAPKALRQPLAIAGAMLASILATTLLGTDIYLGFTFGILSGLCSVFLLLRHDILSVIAFNVAGSIPSFLFAFEMQPVLAPIIMVIVAGIAIMGFVAYMRPPEAVSEEDYKPSFLYRMEEEKRIQREIEAAKTVQQRLLPDKLPNFPAVNVAASCVPAFEVGGDYYDFFTLDEHRLGLLIGDVSGKGMTAAFYITLAKGVIVSQIRQSGSAADVLHRVNSLLYGVMERGRFISMIYAVYDTRTRVLEFANAGHNPMLRRQGKTGEVETIDSRGMAIGLDSGKVFDRAVVSQSVQLEIDDVVVFYTDGVTEAMQNTREEFTEKRLISSISRAKNNAADIVAGIIESVNQFVGNARQHDDITILAIQVKEQGEPATSAAAELN